MTDFRPRGRRRKDRDAAIDQRAPREVPAVVVVVEVEAAEWHQQHPRTEPKPFGEHEFVNRATLGFTYRPVPLVAFQLAYERTWTDNGKSLASVTNFIPARRSEDTQNSFLFGVAFGF